MARQHQDKAVALTWDILKQRHGTSNPAVDILPAFDLHRRIHHRNAAAGAADFQEIIVFALLDKADTPAFTIGHTGPEPDV